MPELHKLTPPLGVLQDRGHRVALLTDGRMSGASGKIPAAIHLTPEAADDGPIARLRDGDPIRLDADAGTIEVLVDAAEFAARPPAGAPDREFAGTGRELFESFRRAVGPADAGASVVRESDAEHRRRPAPCPAARRRPGRPGRRAGRRRPRPCRWPARSPRAACRSSS